MKGIFSEEAEHRMVLALRDDFCSSLPEPIRRHTGMDYECTETDHGCFLKPTFKNMVYRNSFEPEITVSISQNDGHTTLNFSGRPTMPVRIFMVFWFGFLFVMLSIVLLAAVVSELDNALIIIVPVFMCVFGYCLCKFATKGAFDKIVTAIREEYP